jgi:imidazolonepropionase-like amidohydrolase
MPMRCLLLALALAAPLSSHAQIEPGPDRRAGEGGGPYTQLILRGVTVINGTGAPANGPLDIVIRGNRIERIAGIGYPGVPIDPERRPKLEAGGREIDLTGHFVLPGFIDLHGHIGGEEQGTPAEYVYKLWLGHGVTTVRDPGCGNSLDWCLAEQKRSAANAMVAPRIHPYVFFGQGRDGPFTTPAQAREWVRAVAERGAEGIKFFGYRPDIMQAAIEEAKARGLRTTTHHAQMDVRRVNVLTSARWGLDSMEHWYGLPEALFDDRTIQDYPADYNYGDEQHRFENAGRLWRQAAKPGSEHWNAVRDELIGLDFTLDPTFTIYQATRDFMRARTAEWHQAYTLPSLWRFFAPNRKAHGSFWFAWGSEQETGWRENYRLWMAFVNDYKNHGGRVTVGSDSGYIYKTYGFGYIEELELLREAGFHPLEVMRAATLSGAEALGVADQVGSIEAGKLADLVVVAENPLADLKVLLGTGAVRVSADNEAVRVGGVRYTIKDGIVYDARELLADVRRIVADAKRTEGLDQLPDVAPPPIP